MERILYYHGGPGLNGNPERHLLHGAYRDAGFDLHIWDEPSVQRPDGPRFQDDHAYVNYLASAEEFMLANHDGAPVIMVGHSFGAIPVHYLAKRHPGRIRQVVFLSSDFVVRTTDRNTLVLTAQDFRSEAPALAAEMDDVLEKYTGQFDANVERGIHLALQNPRFFDHYWHNKPAMQSFLAYYTPPAFSFDLRSFLAVRRDLSGFEDAQCPIPAIAIYGRHETIVSKDAEIDFLAARYPRLKIFEMENSAHYPHVEEVGETLRIITEAVSPLRTG